MRAPTRWERRARSLQERVLAIEDEGVRFTVALILEALNDPEDDCCFAVFASQQELHIEGFAMEEDIGTALVERVGEETMQAAVRWLQDELRGGDPAWTAWVLHRVKVPSHPGMQEVVSARDGVVYDIEKRKITWKRKK